MRLTEDQIEYAVECKVNALDRRFMDESVAMSQAEYDREIKSIDLWSRSKPESL